MKLKNTITTLLIAGLAVTAAHAETNIVWDSPEDYRDMSYRDSNTEKDRLIVMKDLEKYFVHESDNVFTEDLTLTVTITDVDLAGDFEPWRTNVYDIRIVKSIYPARISFEYTMTSADGSIITEGSETLRDTHLIAPIHMRNDDYPYVKDLYRSWVRKLANTHIS